MGVGGRLLARWLAGPGGVGRLWCRGGSSPILASAVAGIAPAVIEGVGVVGDDAEAAMLTLVALVMLMVRVLPAVVRVLVLLVMPMARALQVMHCRMVPLVML